MNNRLTKRDIAHLRAEYARIIAPYRGMEDYLDNYADVMTSIGYVGMGVDGEIYDFGRTIYTLEDVDDIEPSEPPDPEVLRDCNVPFTMWPRDLLVRDTVEWCRDHGFTGISGVIRDFADNADVSPRETRDLLLADLDAQCCAHDDDTDPDVYSEARGRVTTLFAS